MFGVLIRNQNSIVLVKSESEIEVSELHVTDTRFIDKPEIVKFESVLTRNESKGMADTCRIAYLDETVNLNELTARYGESDLEGWDEDEYAFSWQLETKSGEPIQIYSHVGDEHGFRIAARGARVMDELKKEFGAERIMQTYFLD